LAALGVDQWHKTGARGRGAKVAILDTGFRGYKNFLGTALPANVTARSFRKDGNLEARDSQHGILCGEVIHTLAPDAELLIANWEQDDAESFLRAVQWARDEGARVISCSVIMPCYSDGEGGGPFHERLTKILGRGSAHGDTLMFASAGNTAERHWAGTFHANAEGFHEWRPGTADNVLIPWDDERVSVEVSCKPESHYDVLVYDHNSGTEVAHSSTKNELSTGATARFMPASGHSYFVRVRLASGRPGPFHIVALHARLKEATAGGSVAFPADGPEVIAVGAVDRAGRRTSYSACGSATCKSKPDLVAPVPFQSAWRARPFAGTSAAAPQAAAVAALVWSSHSDWNAEQVRTALRTSAHDLGPPGYDPETGFGEIHLPALPKVERAAR
jgi:subtilisin family serine protease